MKYDCIIQERHVSVYFGSPSAMRKSACALVSTLDLLLVADLCGLLERAGFLKEAQSL